MIEMRRCQMILSTRTTLHVCYATGCQPHIFPGKSLSRRDRSLSICLDCHHYSDNHHAVNFIPASNFNNAASEKFPLFDGEIRCLTRHRVHGGQVLAAVQGFSEAGLMNSEPKSASIVMIRTFGFRRMGFRRQGYLYKSR